MRDFKPTNLWPVWAWSPDVSRAVAPGPEEVLRRHGNETFYADDTRGNYAHPKLADYVQERCHSGNGVGNGSGNGSGVYPKMGLLLKWKMVINIDKRKAIGHRGALVPIGSSQLSQAAAP